MTDLNSNQINHCTKTLHSHLSMNYLHFHIAIMITPIKYKKVVNFSLLSVVIFY